MEPAPNEWAWPSMLASSKFTVWDFYKKYAHGSDKYLWKDDWRREKAFGKVKFLQPSGVTFEGDFKLGWMEDLGTFIDLMEICTEGRV